MQPATTAAIDAAFADLVSAVGDRPRRADRHQLRPAEPRHTAVATDPPPTIRVEFLELPDQATIDSQQLPWMHAADTAVLPERLVVLGFNGDQQTLLHVGRPIPSELSIGPNPSAPQEEQLRVEDGELVVPDPMQWMTDFDVAVDNGMGFRIDLDSIQARRGFDRLFVLGVRISADPEAGAADLEDLITDHQRSRKGFSVLAQGAPTNNVEDDVSGYTWRDDTDLSFEHFFGQDPTDDPDEWRDRKDGRWLAEHLGIDAELLKASPDYYGTDQAEARAMNEALWPATFGYLLDQMMEPVFDDDTIVSTRDLVQPVRRRQGCDPGHPRRSPAVRHPAGHAVLADGMDQPQAARQRPHRHGHPRPVPVPRHDVPADPHRRRAVDRAGRSGLVRRQARGRCPSERCSTWSACTRRRSSTTSATPRPPSSSTTASSSRATAPPSSPP